MAIRRIRGRGNEINKDENNFKIGLEIIIHHNNNDKRDEMELRLMQSYFISMIIRLQRYC
jgi:hypothetical protein